LGRAQGLLQGISHDVSTLTTLLDLLVSSFEYYCTVAQHRLRFVSYAYKTHRGGDWGSLTQLFFDNLSTLLGALYAIQNMINFGAPKDDIDTIVWGSIVPGVGITLFIGNAYYTWMGIRLTNKWGRPYTAQPYGLNTPQAFAFVFNVMCKKDRRCKNDHFLCDNTYSRSLPRSLQIPSTLASWTPKVPLLPFKRRTR
jgi:hypothetical protein